MNYMKNVAEMLGLSWDDEKQESEKFMIIGYEKPYKIYNVGLFEYDVTTSKSYPRLISHWDNDINDNARYKRGLVFKTEEEAIKKAEEILKMLEVN